MSRHVISAAVLLFALLTPLAAYAQEDAEGCSEHPLFSRMPGFYLAECEVRDFDRFEFQVGEGQYQAVEGKRYHFTFNLKDGIKPVSSLELRRNFEAAAKKASAKQLYAAESLVCFKFQRGKSATWAQVDTTDGTHYYLDLVEPKEMEQQVLADAKVLGDDLVATGRAAVYGIYFDTGKAVVKPESEPALAEIAKLLAQTPTLKLHVVGHTDSVGSFEANMKLSRERAEAVVAALTSRHKVAAARLKPSGVASLAPLASNREETGRARNRRVELVEQ